MQKKINRSICSVDLAIFKTYPHLRKPMSGAFDIAWALLKADPNQQLLEPYFANPWGTDLEGQPNKWEKQNQPVGTMHPAITGMMERQGIQQPAQGSYGGPLNQDMLNREPYGVRTTQGPVQPNPVERQRQGSSMDFSRHSDLSPHDERQDWLSAEHRAEYPQSGYDGHFRPVMRGNINQPIVPTENFPHGGSAPPGVSPYQNVMQTM